MSNIFHYRETRLHISRILLLFIRLKRINTMFIAKSKISNEEIMDAYYSESEQKKL